MQEYLAARASSCRTSPRARVTALQADVAVVPGATRRWSASRSIWIVSRRDGEEFGRVVQMNEIPTGRLNRLWGDIAYVAANEAAAA